MHITINYNKKNGTPVRDGDVSDIVNKWIEDHEDIYFTAGTSNIIEEVRLAVAQAKIKPENVVFIFNDKEITFNGIFDLSEWPTGFCDLNLNQSYSIFQERQNNK